MSYDDEERDSEDPLDSDDELNSDQKKKLRRDLAMMGFEDDEEYDEINEANARMIENFHMDHLAS